MPPGRLARAVAAFMAAVVVVSILIGTSAAGIGAGAAGDRVYDPEQANVVFLPGLLGSELGCGPDLLEPVNLWPGQADTRSDWRKPFGSLALINTVASGGGVESRTTSSEEYPTGCGSTDFGGGTVARREPRPLGPTWCIPESRDDNPDPTACASWQSASYSTFGLQLEAALDAAGSGQELTSHGWDWRLSPAAQAEALDRAIVDAGRNGVKVTVVAHSFGNTLFREWMRFVQERGGEPGDYVGRFVSVAGPWWGVATAWTHPAYGSLQPGTAAAILAREIGTDTITEVFQTSPGPYWLLPLSQFNDYVTRTSSTAGEQWLAVRDGIEASKWVGFDDVDEVVEETFTRCPQNEIFDCIARDLYDSASAAAPSDPSFDRAGIEDWAAISGSAVQTPLQICDGCTTWPDGGTDGAVIDTTDPTVRRHAVRYTNGDGNVPVFSAVQGRVLDHLGSGVSFYFTCGYTHMELMQESAVISRSIPYIVGASDLAYDDVLKRESCALPTDSETDAPPDDATPTPAAALPAQPVAAAPRLTG